MENLEDWDFWLSLLNPDSVVYRIEEVMVYYRVRHDGRHTQGGNVWSFETVAREISSKHKEIYAPYLQNVLYYRSEGLEFEEEYRRIKERYDGVLASKAYRVGKLLLRPFAWLRKHL